MPIWILDRGSGAYGILHSGWRGTGILSCRHTLFGGALRLEEPRIALGHPGPVIGPCCYAVPEEKGGSILLRIRTELRPRTRRFTYLDLRSANVSIAEASGVGQVLSVEACTSCDKQAGLLSTPRRRLLYENARSLRIFAEPGGDPAREPQ